MRKFLPRRLPLILALLGTPALADINMVIDKYIIANTAAFTQSTANLAISAQKDCTPKGMKAAFHHSFDAWVRTSHIRFGPLESSGEVLATVFWPDKKGKIPKILFKMIKDENPVVYDAKLFAGYSVATRGFFALEQLLYDDKFSNFSADSYSCDLVRAITKDLSRIALQTHAGWLGGYADLLRNSGAEGNQTFLTEKEGPQVLFTSLLGGLEYIHRQQLGRPLHKFQHRRPKRAEAWRSNRSLRNVIISLESLREMATILADGHAWESMELFDSTIAYAKKLDDDVFARIQENSANFQLGSLQQMVGATHEMVNAELGAHLGVVAGFNALDGD